MSRGGPFDAVSFDLDNTLVDRDGAARAWWAAVLHEVGAGDALDEVLVRDAHGHAPREEVFGWAAARFGLGAGSGLWARFRAELPRFVARDLRVVALVDRVRARYRVGVVTNGASALQRAKLAAAGLADRVDVVVVSEEVGARKPDPAPFVALCQALDVAPNDVLHVGDHPVDDVAGALRAGLHACWVCRPPLPRIGGEGWGEGEARAPGTPVRIPHVTSLPEVLPC